MGPRSETIVGFSLDSTALGRPAESQSGCLSQGLEVGSVRARLVSCVLGSADRGNARRVGGRVGFRGHQDLRLVG